MLRLVSERENLATDETFSGFPRSGRAKVAGVQGLGWTERSLCRVLDGSGKSGDRRDGPLVFRDQSV